MRRVQSLPVHFRVMRLCKSDTRSQSLAKYSRLVRKFHGNRCAVCGLGSRLHAHHLIHRSTHPGLSFVMNNGIALCRDHHDEAHWRRIRKRWPRPGERHGALPFSYTFGKRA